MVQRMSGAHRTGSSRLYLLFKSETEAWVPGPWCGSEWAWLHGAYAEGYLGEALLRMWRRMPVLTQPYDLWWWWQWCGEDRRALEKTFLGWVTSRGHCFFRPLLIDTVVSEQSWLWQVFSAKVRNSLQNSSTDLESLFSLTYFSVIFLFYVETDHDYFMIYLEAYLTDNLWFSFI